MSEQLTLEKVNEHLEYRDGKLFWKIPRKGLNKLPNGDYPAGWDNGEGYIKLSFLDKTYYAHHIVFFIHHGRLPISIDHIDGNPSNNLHTNLRAATSSENQVNQPKSIKNTSGAKNVYWVEEHQKWRVRVQIQGQRFDFGYYDDFEDAALVAETARKQIHKEFANHE